MTKYSQYVTNKLNDPREMDAYTRKHFGQDARSFEVSLAALADVRAGRMPEGTTFKQLAHEAQQYLGWSEKQTRLNLQRIVDMPMPQQRVGAFLHAGGRQVTAETLNTAYRLADDYDRTRSEVGLEMKIGERQQREANDPFSKKNIPEFKNGAAEKQDAQSLRNALEFFSGVHKPDTFADKQAAVMKARLQVADRYEQHVANPNPSLRESVAAEVEVHKVNALSKEYGLGDPISVANETNEREMGHMSESFDPIESTGLIDDR